MKVSSIRQQQKRLDCYSIYLDDIYRLSLSGSQLLEFGVRQGAEYSAVELEQLVRQSVSGKFYNRALDYCLRRPRSCAELTSYLYRVMCFPKQRFTKLANGQYRALKQQVLSRAEALEIIKPIMAKLQKQGYVGDQQFAQSWVRSRQLNKPTSQRKLQQELRQKGVNEALIEQTLNQAAFDDRLNLRNMIAKKRKLTRYQDATKLMRYLQTQGFGYSDIIAEMKSDLD